MAKAPKKEPQNSIETGFKEVQKAYKKGAETTNNTYARQAGQDLKSGDARLMTTYRANKRSIERLGEEDED
ncbi:hypothetical protein [Aeromonas sobria]|uniref:hypothetical protein n=1 Tax=Aeromonas sobria TaxID=646 RepID=UPI001119E222|nr:hypothetical protein [Aeromonas sobria]TNH94730.1 hypothetical protein CF137_12145 [Aeromonas sobria]